MASGSAAPLAAAAEAAKANRQAIHQGLTLVHLKAQLGQLQDTFMR